MKEDIWLCVDDFARWWFKLQDGEKPTKAQRNSIYNRAKRGTLDHRKFGGRLFIKKEGWLT